ncbi:bone morphogenetic protein 3-like [Lytechinus pictus]|uniref:bone morphogenetic protein 3-like n=1 Tax=Lytechinus pictus TaxID=7653 RepID=UPI0030B9AE84
MRPMHSLDDPEELKYAELHFYAKNFLEIDSQEHEEIPISFYYIKASECHPIGVQNLKIPKNGWLVTNVTSLLNHVLIDATERVTIAMYIGEGVVSHQATPYQDGSHEKLVKPFVFLYTEDVSAEKGNAQSNWQRLAEKLARKEMDSLLPDQEVRRRRSAEANDTNETFDDNDTLFSNEVVDVEPVDNNEYPLHPVVKTFPATTHTAFSFFAEQNMRRIKSNRRRARNQRKKEKSKNMMLDAEEKSRARKKKLNKPRPKHLDIGPVTEATDVCDRHSMNVDFQAIGWDDYVIAPARFQAFYCAGQCSFPIQKELHPSNHALIQSIMHLLGVQTGVPTPCCVPDKMEPLILLYIERDSTVTLKKYSDMIVESCGCH